MNETNKRNISVNDAEITIQQIKRNALDLLDLKLEGSLGNTDKP